MIIVITMMCNMQPVAHEHNPHDGCLSKKHLYNNYVVNYDNDDDDDNDNDDYDAVDDKKKCKSLTKKLYNI